jgi:hypothetical protein
MGVPEGRGNKWMVPIGKVIRDVHWLDIGGPDYFKFVVPIKIFVWLLKYFLTLGLTKTSFFSNSLTERARQI